LECEAPLHRCKAPYWRLAGHDSVSRSD